MKFWIACILSVTAFYGFTQPVETIEVPKGISYKYCPPLLLDEAKQLLMTELSDSTTYALNDGIVCIGPILWARYKSQPPLRGIAGGNVAVFYQNQKLSAKITHDREAFKKVWDHFRTEVAGDSIILRKANPAELTYYWSVVSFDIEEPLLIAETGGRRFILNLSPKSMKLLWLDEVPGHL